MSSTTRVQGEPREVSNTMLGLVVSYVRRVMGGDDPAAGDDAVRRMLELAGERRDLAVIEDRAEWSPFESAVRIFDAAIAVTGDPLAVRKAGADIFRHYHSSEVIGLLLSMKEPEAVMRLITEFAAKQTTLCVHRCVETSPTHAVIVVEESRVALSAWCDYSAGVFSAIPEVFGYAPAVVDHVTCRARGDSTCRFEVRWRNEPAADPRDEIAALRDQVASLTARFESLEAMATELASVDDIDAALATITRRAAVAVRAPRYVLAVRLPLEQGYRVHHLGMSDEAAAELADVILADDPPDDGSLLVVDVASSLHRFGRLAAVHTGHGRFVASERRLLQAYAGHAAAALQTAAALAEARLQVRTLGALLDLSTTLVRTRTVDEAAQCLADALATVLECRRAATLVWDAATRQLVCFGRASDPAGSLPTDVTLSDEGARRLLEADEPLTVTPADGELGPVAALAGFDRALLAPVAARGALLGVIVVDVTSTCGSGLAALRDRLPGVAGLSATALDNATLLEQVRHQATHDPLTGLPNLRMLRDVAAAPADEPCGGRPVGLAAAGAEGLVEIARRDRPGSGRTAMLFVDLDGFKEVNDQFGHAIGDEVLVVASARLHEALRDGDEVFRVGGDEFVVLLRNVDGVAEATAAATRLQANVHEPVAVNGRAFTVSASVGVAVAEDGETVDSLLSRADAAMYTAKRAGRDAVRLAPSPR